MKAAAARMKNSRRRGSDAPRPVTLALHDRSVRCVGTWSLRSKTTGEVLALSLTTAFHLLLSQSTSSQGALVEEAEEDNEPTKDTSAAGVDHEEEYNVAAGEGGKGDDKKCIIS